MPMFVLISALLLPAACPQPSHLQCGEQELAMDIRGKWLPALKAAYARFDRVPKQSPECYRIRSYEQGGRLIVDFTAEADDPSISVRGQRR